MGDSKKHFLNNGLVSVICWSQGWFILVSKRFSSNQCQQLSILWAIINLMFFLLCNQFIPFNNISFFNICFIYRVSRGWSSCHGFRKNSVISTPTSNLSDSYHLSLTPSPLPSVLVGDQTPVADSLLQETITHFEVVDLLQETLPTLVVLFSNQYHQTLVSNLF